MPTSSKSGSTFNHMFGRVLVILNPTSGQREVSESQRLIETCLASKGIAFDLRLTTGANDALRWAQAAEAEGYDAVVAAGGDGTVVEALNGLLKSKSDVPLLTVPLGTANGLARTIKLPLEPEAALEAALEGQVASLDVGYVLNRDHYFLLFAGVGYDAQVIREADRNLKDKHGFWAYVLAAFKQLKKRRNQPMTLVLDGKRVSLYAHSVIMFNANEFILAGVPLGPKTNANDGKLDIAVLRDPSAWGTFVDIWKLLLHRLHPRPPDTWQASSLAIETLSPLPFQTDGDEQGYTPVKIEVKPNAARVVVPKAYIEATEEDNQKLTDLNPLPV
jgi:diacylglycerol kinase (ATP)